MSPPARARRTLCHLFSATCVALAVLWSMRAPLGGHLTLHLLGMTAVTLMFGVRGAIAAATFALAALCAIDVLPWETLAINALAVGVLPAVETAAWLRSLKRWLPANFLVHVFVTAFLGGALAMALATLAGTAALVLAGT